MNGGYVMIDCTGLDLTKGSTEQTISGIYSRVRECMKAGKPIFANNCVWGNDGVVTPIAVMAIQFPGYVIVTSSTLQIVITSSDTITIVNLVS